MSCRVTTQAEKIEIWSFSTEDLRSNIAIILHAVSMAETETKWNMLDSVVSK